MLHKVINTVAVKKGVIILNVESRRRRKEKQNGFLCDINEERKHKGNQKLAKSQEMYERK